MYKIALINMPFAGLHFPSLALTQLKAVADKQFGDQVQTDVLYLNHDFGQFIGQETYAYLSDEGITTLTGLTDWFFYEVAFQETDAEREKYLARYKQSFGLSPEEIDTLLQKRSELHTFLGGLIDDYQLDTYDVIGFSSMFDQMIASFALAAELRKRNSHLVTIIGGASCELSTGQVIARKLPMIDFVFSGPGLKSFETFVSKLITGKREEWHEIPGVYSSKNIDQVLQNKSRWLGEDTNINTRVPINYQDFLQSFSEKCAGIQPQLFFETSRGCWWGEKSHCTFCGLNGVSMKYRTMSAENAIDQFQELFENYPEAPLFFAVDNILDVSYFQDVFPYIQVPRNSNVFYETKVITDKEHMAALATAGITVIQPGIEALATSTLKLMKKGTTAFQNIRFLKMALQYGITPDWNLLIGFPGEPEEVYKKYVADIPFLVHLHPPGATFPVRFDRHSPYHTNSHEYGLDLKPLDYYSMLYPFLSEDEIQDFAYFFADHNYDNPYLLNLSRWRRKVEAVVKSWNDKWHSGHEESRPKLVLKEENRTIYDTRFDTAREYVLDDLSVQLLKNLEEPKGLSTLALQSGVDEDAIRERVDYFREQGLIFEEGKSKLSVVLIL